MRDAAPLRLRRFQKPWISAALLLVLFGDALWVSDTSPWASPLAGVRRALLREPAFVTMQPRTPTKWYIARAADGFRYVDPWSDQGAYASPKAEELVSVGSSTTGRWAQTERHFDSRLRVTMFVGPVLSPSERDQIRERCAQSLSPDLEFHDEIVKNLRLPETSDVAVPIPAGYAHNIATLAAIAGFVWSLGWVREAVIRRTRASRQTRGLCPHCCYEVRGLPLPICPECGRPIG